MFSPYKKKDPLTGLLLLTWSVSTARLQSLRLRIGTSTSPKSDRLPLLSSDPGGVHGLLPYGTHPSTLPELVVTVDIGKGGIRTRDRVAPIHALQACALNQTQPPFQTDFCKNQQKKSAPERTRTSGHQIRNLMLYPN